jgi:hypothetical protein
MGDLITNIAIFLTQALAWLIVLVPLLIIAIMMVTGLLHGLTALLRLFMHIIGKPLPEEQEPAGGGLFGALLEGLGVKPKNKIVFDVKIDEPRRNTA